jgi:hypothetical protein
MPPSTTTAKIGQQLKLKLFILMNFLLKPENLDAFVNVLLLLSLLAILTILVALIVTTSLGTFRCGKLYSGWIFFFWEFLVILVMLISKYFNQWYALKHFLSPFLVTSIALSLLSASLVLNRPNCGGAYITAAIANGIMCLSLFLCFILIYAVELNIIDPLKAFPPIVPQAFVIARDAHLQQAPNFANWPPRLPAASTQPLAASLSPSTPSPPLASLQERRLLPVFVGRPSVLKD